MCACDEESIWRVENLMDEVFLMIYLAWRSEVMQDTLYKAMMCTLCEKEPNTYSSPWQEIYE